jgi:acetyl esterase/lipase
MKSISVRNRALQLAAIAFAIAAKLPTSQAQENPPALPESVRFIADVEYVESGHERQKLDLYLPRDGKKLPLIVWIHGGAWQGGNKNGPPALRSLLPDYAVASINYRLSQHATFPAQLEDCKAAIRWLRAHSEDYGYDKDHIGVWGASAGGHLVALLGTTSDVKTFDVGENLGQSSSVQAVVDFFGPTDFLQINRQAGANSRLNHDAPDSPESRLVGGPVLENPEKSKRANPITYISAEDPPFLIMHGEEDDIVPIGQSELLDASLRQADVSSTFRRVPNAGHGFGGPDIVRTVRTFFDEHLNGANDRSADR